MAMMTDADMALKVDPDYRKISEALLQDQRTLTKCLLVLGSN